MTKLREHFRAAHVAQRRYGGKFCDKKFTPSPRRTRRRKPPVPRPKWLH